MTYITGAFSKYDFCAYQFDVKLFQKSSPENVQKRVPRVASLFAKSGFFIDFQDFQKIDVEITQCQYALKPVLLPFGISPKTATPAPNGVFRDFHEN